MCCWPCQRSLSRVRVPWDLRPYFTVSHLRLPFSSLPTTRRVTVQVFDPASTRVIFESITCPPFIISGRTCNSSSIILCVSDAQETCVYFVATIWFPSVHNFQFSYPWKTCSVTSWCPRINFSAATYLPIRFLETADMSQYDHVNLRNDGHWNFIPYSHCYLPELTLFYSLTIKHTNVQYIGFR
jgi:hypothetical protein